LLRTRSGFDIKELASEYRALRATVLRLWTDACLPEPPNREDMIRFNEAIDQALAESIAIFSDRVDEARNLLLGMLGHDMRTPLQSILMTATYLGHLNAGQKISEAATRLISSGGRMKGLLDELVEFNRANLGLGLRVSPTNVDLADLFADELQELRAAYPDRELVLEVTGNTKGCWDGELAAPAWQSRRERSEVRGQGSPRTHKDCRRRGKSSLRGQKHRNSNRRGRGWRCRNRRGPAPGRK
jgi:signal transduction histidine kinase